ncbi:hypothetical protein TNIN_217471 [Trichonephila inaurata madagascariensis]|uniref:Uncharacterized protein n=1 Tax=Trichonephila inaurata madagascariensis TaxID=2747483 RepID=A0A8X7CDP3_9ARAC|nr:hypothetical protein TNIN_217471 [Trichonephila inaurata madagascariensis]
MNGARDRSNHPAINRFPTRLPSARQPSGCKSFLAGISDSCTLHRFSIDKRKHSILLGVLFLLLFRRGPSIAGRALVRNKIVPWCERSEREKWSKRREKK